MTHMNFLTKQKETHRLREWTYGCLWERDSEGFRGGHVHTAVFKMDNQQGPIVQYMELCSMWCGSLDGRGVWGEWIHAYVWLNPFAVHLKQSQHG